LDWKKEAIISANTILVDHLRRNRTSSQYIQNFDGLIAIQRLGVGS
jgi:hypothetical protein